MMPHDHLPNSGQTNLEHYINEAPNQNLDLNQAPNLEHAHNEGTHPSANASAKAAFLEARRKRLTQWAACADVGIQQSTVWRWRKADPEFDAAVQRVLDEGEAIERLEENVYERAYKDPILAMFTLKAHKPMYNDRVQAAKALAAATSESPAQQALAAMASILRDAVGLPGAQRQGWRPRQVVEGVALPAPPAPRANVTRDGAGSGQ